VAFSLREKNALAEREHYTVQLGHLARIAGQFVTAAISGPLEPTIARGQLPG